MISNGEPHLPGRPSTVEGLKSLATLAKASAENNRPGGVKVRAGTLILTDGMSEDDIEEVYQAGIDRLKFLTPVEDRDLARNLVEWGHDREMVTMMHCGGTSLPGVESTDADMFFDVGPDVAAHVNGGPTPVADEDVERLVTETDVILDLVLAGNQRIAVEVLERAAERDELHRIQLGTDTPSGTGVTPLGVLLEASILAGMTDVSGAEILCLATGTTAAHHDLDVGVVEPDRPADFAIMDAPVGGQVETAIETLERGECPAVGAVLVDGEVVVNGSRNTAPPKREPAIREGGGPGQRPCDFM
jgi:enamidase